MTKPASPLVSVIVPAYNHERFVEEAVRSIWGQSYPNLELIVLDDGSRDRTADVVEAMVSDSPIPMRLVRKENEGLCRTLNRGLSLARGEYVSFCASDDRYLPEHLATLVPVLAGAAEPLGFVHADCLLIDEMGRRTGHRFSDRGRAREGWIFEEMLTFRAGIQPITVLYPARVLREVGGFREDARFEDWEMFLRITHRYPVRYVPAPVAEYRTHGGDQLNRKLALLLPDMLRIFEEHAAKHPRSADPRWSRAAYASLHLRLGQSFYTIRDFKEARRWLLRAVWRRPAERAAWALLLRTLVGPTLISRISALRRGSR